MEIDKEIETLNEYAEKWNDYTAVFRMQLSKLVPVINKSPDLYDMLSQKSQKIIVEHIYVNPGFEQEVILNKILKKDTKLTFDGCQLVVLQSRVPEQVVQKIVKNHLNEESWDKCASHVVKEFFPYMNDKHKSLFAEYNEPAYKEQKPKKKEFNKARNN